MSANASWWQAKAVLGVVSLVSACGAARRGRAGSIDAGSVVDAASLDASSPTDGDGRRDSHDGSPAEDADSTTQRNDAGPAEALCEELLPQAASLLLTLLDRDTGLPYDQLGCGGPQASSASGINPALGVVPQLAYAGVSSFAEDGARIDAVRRAFVDDAAGSEAPDLLYALRIDLALDEGSDGGAPNRFGGVIWQANADISRYQSVRVRYRTGSSAERWQFKLNAGTPSQEPLQFLEPTGEQWVEVTFDLARDFPGLDRSKLNYLVIASSIDQAGSSPNIWIDRIAFQPDPTAMDRCDVECGASAYPDLACLEPMTGAVNVANALTALTLLPETGTATASDARNKIERILNSLASLPGSPGSASPWRQDWHSPVSGMPDPRNSIASLTDEPQLYAALMVVEAKLPEFAASVRALRARFDFSLLYDGSAGCPGQLHWAVDRCGGIQAATLQYFGNDSLLGQFLAVATGQVPTCFWTQGLATSGCALDGPADAPWYTTGRFCSVVDLPASDTGGPFLQLAALLYLTAEQVPLGALSLAESARNMIAAQAGFARSHGLPLFGWANASDSDVCDYRACERLSAQQVTPYVSAMALDLMPEAGANLLEFVDEGAAAPLNTGTRLHSFGFRDAWNLTAHAGRDAYLYLDTGWSVLGLLNACQGGLVRKAFASHPVAAAGYQHLATGAPACAPAGP